MTIDTQRYARRLIARAQAEENIRRRAVQEMIGSALARQWTERAGRFADALPQPGDYPGGPCDWETGRPLNPPPPDPHRAARIRDTIAACQAKARLLQEGLLDD